MLRHKAYENFDTENRMHFKKNIHKNDDDSYDVIQSRLTRFKH